MRLMFRNVRYRTWYLVYCPFFSFFSFLSFLSPLFSLFPLFVSVCLAFCFLCLLFAFCFFFCFALSSFPLFFVSFFLLPWYSWWRSLFALIRIFILHLSRCLRACNLRKSAYSLVCFLSCFLACFFFSLPFLIMISISISIFRRRVVFLFHSVFFLWVLCGPLGFCGDLYSVPHVPDTYVRGPHFYFCLRCTMWFRYHVYYSLLYFYFFRGILPLQSYWSLSCDHGLHCIVAMS